MLIVQSANAQGRGGDAKQDSQVKEDVPQEKAKEKMVLGGAAGVTGQVARDQKMKDAIQAYINETHALGFKSKPGDFLGDLQQILRRHSGGGTLVVHAKDIKIVNHGPGRLIVEYPTTSGKPAIEIPAPSAPATSISTSIEVGHGQVKLIALGNYVGLELSNTCKSNISFWDGDSDGGTFKLAPMGASLKRDLGKDLRHYYLEMK